MMVSVVQNHYKVPGMEDDGLRGSKSLQGTRDGR